MRGDASDGGSTYARTQTSMSGASSITSLGACVFDPRRQQRTYCRHGNAKILLYKRHRMVTDYRSYFCTATLKLSENLLVHAFH